ncbi:unnamed protein product [Thelazia callipaeda]|uniref:Uncharacterized protein n=1 Tax=Thelazia callipaeda TaxID=103827 RepID=A0A0N5CND9_THECL|nr:unnamed protein product [Thelazia callipaeda]
MPSKRNCIRNYVGSSSSVIKRCNVTNGKLLNATKSDIMDKTNSLCTKDSFASAMSLQSLDDVDFRNLLNSAAKPQYGSLQRKSMKLQKSVKYDSRRLSDTVQDSSLSVKADNLLAQFRREAQLNQLSADMG